MTNSAIRFSGRRTYCSGTGCRETLPMTETPMRPLTKCDARMPVAGRGRKVLEGARLSSWRYIGLLTGFLSLPAAGEQESSSHVTAMGETSRIQALLVGVDFYQDRRWRQFDLEGPANDVLMISRKLIGLGVSSKRIVALVSDEPSDTAAREFNRLGRDLNRSGPPTRERILAELRWMADDAAPGKLQLLWILLVQVDLLLIAGMTTIALACWQRPSIRSLPAIVSSSDAGSCWPRWN